MNRSIDYIEQLNHANKKICNLYTKLKIFFSEQIGFPSYYKVRGEDYCDIPDQIPLEDNKAWPIQNANWHSLEKAVRACERLGGILLSPARHEKLIVLSRDFMLEGSTLPIRVIYRITNGRKYPYILSLFVKQMNLNRIFLNVLYHLASGKMPAVFFSESSVVEQNVQGKNIIEVYNKDHTLLSKPEFKREFIRFNVIAQFITLNDMDNGANIVINRQGQLRVIDFHQGFWEPVSDPSVKLINPFVYKIKGNNNGENDTLLELPDEKLRKHFRDSEIERLIRQETARVCNNIERNISIFYKTIDAMSDIAYYNLAAKEIYNEENISSYFINRLRQFKKRGAKAP